MVARDHAADDDRHPRRLERSLAHPRSEVAHVPLEGPAVGAALEVRSDHPLLELRELPVEQDGDLSTDPVADER